MSRKSELPEPDDALRRRAESLVPAAADPGAEVATRRLLEELQVYQIELELQNAELRQARDEVEAGLARYTDLYDFAPVGYFSFDRAGAVVQVNLTGAGLLETPRSLVLGRRFAGFIAPESRLEFSAFLARAFAGGGKASCELPLLRANDPPLVAHLEASLAESGQECRAVLVDISERKQAEEELRLAATVYQAIGESILVTDADNRILAVNPAFTRVTGYGAPEVLGKTPQLLSSGRHDQAFYQRMWQSLQATGHWEGEIWDRRENGEEYLVWLSINTVFDTEGRVLRRVALFSDITDQKKAEQTIWRQANYDALTGLPNRRLFHDRLQQEIDKCERDALALALLFVDLDRFKEVNDSLGHAAGDRLLAEVARRISECVRSTDTVARLGGDEFAIIMADLSGSDRVGVVAQGLVEALAQPFSIGEEVIQVSASVGITLYPVDATAVDDLLRQADLAMYEAKNQGRNRFRYFTATMQVAVQARLSLIKDLREALPGQQFEVVFQPIVDLATGRTVKAEALLHWHHPQRGAVGPAEFIPVAEEIGLIDGLCDWAFREAARWARLWRDGADGPVQVSINLSPQQFLAGDVCAGWLAHLDQIGLPGESLVLEVAEGLLLADRPDITEKLARFRAAGIRIAIDDFGTGYSALSFLKKCAVDYLKIGRAFVRDLETDANDRTLVEAIIVMAHKLGIQVIAEGVETAEQRDLLHAAGCDFAQGRLYARPLPGEQMGLGG